MYTALVAVYAGPANDPFLIDPIPALSNLCSYATSVTPIATVPLYPDPCESCVPIPTPVITPF